MLCAARVNTDVKANTDGKYTLKFNGLSETISAQRFPYGAAKRLARSAHRTPCCSSVSSCRGEHIGFSRHVVSVITNTPMIILQTTLHCC